MPAAPQGIADIAANMPRSTPVIRPPAATRDINGWLGTRCERTQAIHHTGIYRLHLDAQATLDSAGVRQSVQLPEGVQEEEWIASQTVGIYEEVCLVVSLLEDMCSEESCPTMCAGHGVRYSWADDSTSRPIEVSAPEYMRKLVDFSWRKLNDGQLIPTVDGQQFPDDFRAEMSTLLKRFFRVYAHAYLHHFPEIQEVQAEAHLNMFLKHFLSFVSEFRLVSGRDMTPLRGLIENWARREKGACS